MTIMSQDAFGFTVGGTFRQTELPQHTFNYETHFKLTDAEQLTLWAIRNGVSQAMTDSVALGKDSTTKDAVDSWNAKAASLLAGNVPTSGTGGPRISPFERECRAVMIARLVQAGQPNANATKIARNWRDYLGELATSKAEKTGADRQEVLDAAVAKIEQAANARLDAAKTPDATDLV